ncbi:MAG: hypothetical protein OEW21_13890 [Betaproteobacteria bacterium]|nr:hypothetical protein [Betaproteobacteria bacterium]
MTATQCMLLSACVGISGGPVSGRVLEEDSGKPIAGAIVVVRWFGVVGGMGHGGKVCYHVAATLSRDDGSYLVPEWYERENRYGWGMGHREYYVIAYNAGYGWPVSPAQRREGIVLLAPFKGGERKARLSGWLRRHAVWRVERILQTASTTLRGDL